MIPQSKYSTSHLNLGKNSKATAKISFVPENQAVAQYFRERVVLRDEFLWPVFFWDQKV